MKLANVCPVCRRKLAKGVEQRVEELTDRPEGFQPENAVSFVCLLPLSEIIAAVLGSDSPSAQKVWIVYNALVAKFGNEYSVLMDASEGDLSPIADEDVAETVVRVRERKAEVIPGYDVVCGQLVNSRGGSQGKLPGRVQQLNLKDFAS
jgi:PHP family Zn ribbon phosphoesterase